MRFSKRAAGSLDSFSRHLSSWFPTPRLLDPLCSGIDISDASIKWVVLEERGAYRRVLTYGSEPLAPGVVVDGLIQDEAALSESLTAVKSKLGGISYVHAALPEESAYVFSMHVPEKSDRAQIISMIEFESEDRVPVAADMAVYDYDIIAEHDDGVGMEIGVSVFPRELAEAYVAVFSEAGFELQSLEIEARSIARAVSSRSADEPLTPTLDFCQKKNRFSFFTP